jgi:hypothetical protein
MKFALIGVAAVSLLLSGCAATVQRNAASAPINSTPGSTQKIAMNLTGPQAITASQDWGPFRSLWQSAMIDACREVGAQFSMQEGEPKQTGEPGTLLVIQINDYRYLSQGARFGLGVMTGNAYVDANVEYRDLKTGTLLGKKKFDTSSSAWQGIFAPMTDKQVQALSKEIVGEIKVP